MKTIIKKVIFFYTFLLYATSILQCQNSFQGFINNWIKHDDLVNSSISLSVFDVKNTSYIGGINSKKALIPASSLKVIPTLLIYEKLGPDYKFSTKLAYSVSIDNRGILNGNLFIIGSGDPSFGSDRFRGYADKDSLLSLIVSKIQSKGITCIDGNVYVVSNIFDNSNVADTWQWNDLSNYYATGTWGLNYNENKFTISWNTNQKIGQKVEYFSSNPAIPNLKIEIDATVGPKESGDKSYIIGASDQLKKKIIGTLPQSKSPIKTQCTLPHPPLFFAQTLYKRLHNLGYNPCSFAVIDHQTKLNPIIFDSIRSPKLIDLVRETNHKSLNTYCDAFLKHLGINGNNQGNYIDGLSYIDEYLRKLEFDKSAYKLYDGSGLSSRSFITTEALAKFLIHFIEKYNISTLQYILPQAGKDGSVKSLLQNSSAQTHIWVKSGSMENIQSYTGVCQAKSGKWISFSLIINHFTVTHKELRNHLDVLLASIYEYN